MAGRGQGHREGAQRIPELRTGLRRAASSSSGRSGYRSRRLRAPAFPRVRPHACSTAPSPLETRERLTWPDTSCSDSCLLGSGSKKGTAAEGSGGSGMPPASGGGSPRRLEETASAISPPSARTPRGQRVGRRARRGRRARGRTRLPRTSPSLLVTLGFHPNIPRAMCRPSLVQVLLTSCGGTYRSLSSRAQLPKRLAGLRHPSIPSHAVPHHRVDPSLKEES